MNALSRQPEPSQSAQAQIATQAFMEGRVAMNHQPDTAAEAIPPTLQDFYPRQYGVFAADVSTAVRQDIYGEEFGQSNWQTVEEYARVLALCARLAREGRLSRFAYLARKPMGIA